MHKNNFDFLRLVFAIFVIITHSYPLTGIPENDFLNGITLGQLNFSNVGVHGFFVISGYLIFQSMMRSRNWKDFMMRRVLRIYPAYACAVLISVLVGLVVAERGLVQYFTDRSVHAYLIKDLLFITPGRNSIAGVFEHNPYPFAIDGSLWTIPYEFLFYIMLSLLFVVRSKPAVIRVAVFFVYTGLLVFTLRFENSKFTLFPGFDWHSLVHLALYFSSGAILSVLQAGRWAKKNILLLAFFTAWLVALSAGYNLYLQFLLFPPVVILLGSMATPGIAGFGTKFGDWSYGIYLYGFLVQQIIMNYYQFDHVQLTLVAIFISVLCGILSWHLLEKHALKLKRFFP